MGKSSEMQNFVMSANYSSTSRSRLSNSVIGRGTARPSKSKISVELKKSLEASTGKQWSIWEVKKTFQSLGRSRGAMSIMFGKELIQLAARTLPVDLFNKIQGSPTAQYNVTGQVSRPSSNDSLSGKKPQENSPPVPPQSSEEKEIRVDKSPVPSVSPKPEASQSSSAQSFIGEIYSKVVVTTVAATSFLKNPFVVGMKSESQTMRFNLEKGTDHKANGSVTPTVNPVQISDIPSDEKIQVKSVKSEGGSTDWGIDPDMKPYLQDVNLEWKFVEARTRYLVSKLHSFSSSERASRIRLIEELNKHLSQYREARVKAYEEGAVKSLIKILKQGDDDIFVLNVVRETLALLGENPPIKGQGIRVLSIDGGGTRGLVAIEVLRMIERETGKRIHEIFDYICGVSTGSILAFLLGAKRRSLDDCEALYKQLSLEIFTQSTVLGASGLFWNHSYYNTATWEKILKRQIGDSSLLSLARDPGLPRVAAISTVVSQERVFPYVFRTYGFKPYVKPRYAGGSFHEMWQAVRASAAAPTYFEEIKLGHYLHQDGGVLVNNPASVALSEAKTLWQNRTVQSVVSIGTGQTFSSRKDPHLSDLTNSPSSNSPNSLSWKGKFLKVLDSATDTESVHHTLNELLPSHVYFRFNPYLTEMISMDESKAERLEQLQRETQDYLLRNHDKVKHCCATLTKEKGVTNKVIDWWKHV